MGTDEELLVRCDESGDRGERKFQIFRFLFAKDQAAEGDGVSHPAELIGFVVHGTLEL